MPSCIIRGCYNTWKTKEAKAILHVFPKEKEGIRLWLSQSPENFPNIDELVEKIYSQNKYGTVRLCSKHFNDDQYFHEGTKRRLRPRAVPSIFTTETSPSETIRKKSRKRKRTATDAELLNSDETNEASSSVLYFPQTSDASNSFVQQVLPSHLHIVLPSTSLLQMEKPKMVDKAINTDAFFSKKCQAVGTDPTFGKRNTTTQTKFWKGKSQGTYCNIPMENLAKSNQGMSQHKFWQTEKILSTGMGTTDHYAFATTTNQAANKVLPKEKVVKQDLISGDTTSSQAKFQSDENESNPTSPSDHNHRSPSVNYTPVKNIKVECQSPTGSDCEHSPKSDHGGSSVRRRLISESNETSKELRPGDPSSGSDNEDSDDNNSETGSSTDDSEKEDLSTKSTFDNLDGHFSDSGEDAKFTVLKSCFYDLIKLVRCQYHQTCHAPLTNVQIKTLGSVVAVDVLCSEGHNSTLWHSQPINNKITVPNVLLTSKSSPQSVETETVFHNL